MEQTTELGTRESKNIALVNQAVELITSAPNLSNAEIAQQLGISRTHLANIMKAEYAQEYLKRELNERKTRIDTWIQELYTGLPINPSNQRFALKIESDLAKALADKIYPNKTQTTNINLNIDIQQIQEDNEILKEAVSRLPPTIKQLILNNITQIRHEWRLPPTDTV